MKKKIFFSLVLMVIYSGCAKREETKILEPEELLKEEQVIKVVPPEISSSPSLAPEEEKVLQNKRIQEALKIAGFYTGEIDGKIGPKTREAIKKFQSAKGLKADGIVGPQTWRELEKILFSKPTP